MNMTNIIYQGQPGGLPFSITYTPDSDATQTLMLAGSAYSGTKYLLIGIELVFDGNVVATSAVWTNESESHKALSPGFGTVQFPLKFDDNGNIQPVTLTINPAFDGTVFDVNDFLSVVLMG